MITFAIPTGRSYDDCTEILANAGLPVSKLRDPGRSLIIDEGNFRYLLSKPVDIPVIVHCGAAHLGLVGSDVTEESRVPLSELADTGRGRCFMAVAGTEDTAARFEGDILRLMGIKVATKYPRLAERTFEEMGLEIKTIKLNGSIELAPALGLAECIFDVVQSGATLRANGLSVIKRAMEVSLRLVGGRSSLQTSWDSLYPIIRAVSAGTETACAAV